MCIRDSSEGDGNTGCFLPTEWEWEYACRGGYYEKHGMQRRYFWGDKYKAGVEHAWLYENAGDKARLVMNQRNAANFGSAENPNTENGFELFAMIGNVWEWCANRYDPKSVSRSLRGSSFANGNASSARCSYRLRSDPALADQNGGFRVARARKS